MIRISIFVRGVPLCIIWAMLHPLSESAGSWVSAVGGSGCSGAGGAGAWGPGSESWGWNNPASTSSESWSSATSFGHWHFLELPALGSQLSPQRSLSMCLGHHAPNPAFRHVKLSRRGESPEIQQKDMASRKDRPITTDDQLEGQLGMTISQTATPASLGN